MFKVITDEAGMFRVKEVTAEGSTVRVLPDEFENEAAAQEYANRITDNPNVVATAPENTTANTEVETPVAAPTEPEAPAVATEVTPEATEVAPTEEAPASQPEGEATAPEAEAAPETETVA